MRNLEKPTTYKTLSWLPQQGEIPRGVYPEPLRSTQGRSPKAGGEDTAATAWRANGLGMTQLRNAFNSLSKDAELPESAESKFHAGAKRRHGDGDVGVEDLVFVFLREFPHSFYQVAPHPVEIR